MIYLDWASTSPPEPSVLAESLRLAESSYGNPSSKHALGASARAALEEARARLAAAIIGGGSASPQPGRIAFTGSGSEADAIPILAVLRAALSSRRDGSIKPLHLVASSIEHSAVHEQVKLLESLGLRATFVDPGPDGRIDPLRVADAITPETALVAIMAVNNETGAIQPLAEISAAVATAAGLLRRPRPRLHADAVQALGKVPFSPVEAAVDTAAFSAHKIRGPRGVGALWVSGTVGPIAVGGGQEAGLRPGTENLMGAWAFALAAEKSCASFESRYASARRLESRLMAGIRTIGGAMVLPLGRMPEDEAYSPYILSAAFPGLSGEVLARALSDAGIAVSTGAACSSNQRRKGRRVLEAMGVQEDIAFSAIRVSVGETTTEEEADAFLEAASSIYRKLKT